VPRVLRLNALFKVCICRPAVYLWEEARLLGLVRRNFWWNLKVRHWLQLVTWKQPVIWITANRFAITIAHAGAVREDRLYGWTWDPKAQ
jgi:hypothetical protein